MAIKHYTGRLYGSSKVSDFDYDDEIFEIYSVEIFNKDALVYKFPKGSENMDLVVSLPKGVYSTAYMFSDRQCEGRQCEGFEPSICRSLSLVNFNTYDVDCMSHMFDTLITRVLNLGNKFFIGNVYDMSWMFSGIVTEKPIDLGKYFDTSSVEDMSYMFSGAVLRKGFSLGNRFHTGNVISMEGMFYGVTSHRDFTLGNNFDTRNVITMEEMFNQYDEAERMHPNDIMCVIDEEEQEGISASIEEENLDWYTPLLGDKFDTSSVKRMGKMFNFCRKFPENFTLGDKFDTSSVVDMSLMFCSASLPRGFVFGNKFKVPDMPKKQVYVYEGYKGMLSWYTIYPESDLSLFINSGCDLGILFGCVEFSDDYIFPDWFDFDSYFKEISHEKRGDNEVRLHYKNKGCIVSPEILEMILSKDAKVAHDCKRDLLKLLKKGKRIDSIKFTLLESGYDSTVIDYSMNEIIEKLSDSCKAETRALLAIKSNNYSELTISEAQAKLMAKGYPEIVVLRTIMAYIGDQYLTL